MMNRFWMPHLFLLNFLFVMAPAFSMPEKKLHLGKYRFSVHEVRPEIWVSEHCLKSCEALKAVDRYRARPKKPDGPTDGKNPWAWRCLNRAGGKVAVVSDENGNPVSYCIFEDESMVNARAFD